MLTINKRHILNTKELKFSILESFDSDGQNINKKNSLKKHWVIILTKKNTKIALVKIILDYYIQTYSTMTYGTIL